MVNAFLGSNSTKSQEKKQWVAVGASANLISVLFALKGDFFLFFFFGQGILVFMGSQIFSKNIIHSPDDCEGDAYLAGFAVNCRSLFTHSLMEKLHATIEFCSPQNNNPLLLRVGMQSP